MNGRVGWFLPGVAILATAVAIWAGPNLSLAIPAAGVAVLSAALLFVIAWQDSEALARRSGAGTSPRPELFRLRISIRSGPLGREDIIATLDRIERAGPTPDLPSRTADELRQLTRVPPGEFRAYVRTRLEFLEARM